MLKRFNPTFDIAKQIESTINAINKSLNSFSKFKYMIKYLLYYIKFFLNIYYFINFSIMDNSDL